MEPPKPNSKSKLMMEDKLISLVGQGAPMVEEVRVIRNHLLAALIEHTFNLLIVVTIAGFIYLMFGALKHFELLYAVLAIVFMSPYLFMMLKVLPLLKGFYKERYATVADNADLVDVRAGKI